MRSIVIFRFFSHLSLLFVYQCITFLPLIFRFSFYSGSSPVHVFLSIRILFSLTIRKTLTSGESNIRILLGDGAGIWNV